MPKPERSDKYMVWMDCEMTGLDPQADCIIEIATIITDYDLNIIARGPDLAIKQSESVMKNMDPWPRKTHTESGLIDRIRKEGISNSEAEKETLKFIKRYCNKKTAPLCGNSIGYDKSFLASHMPQLYDYLHYRVIDVSTIKLLAREWYKGKYEPPEKKTAHRALADIEESIEELKFYRKHVFKRAS